MAREKCLTVLTAITLNSWHSSQSDSQISSNFDYPSVCFFFSYSCKQQVPTFSAFERILLSADDLSSLALGNVDASGRLLLLFHDPRPAVTLPSDFLGWKVFLCAHPCNAQQGRRCFLLPSQWNPDPTAQFPPASFFSCGVACSPGSTHISTSMSFVLVWGPLCWLIHQQENSTTCAWEAVSFSDPARHSFRVTISERPFLTSQIRLTLPGAFSHIFSSLIMLSFFPFLLPFLPPFHPSFLPPFLMEYKHIPFVFFRTRSDVTGIAGRHRYVSP